MSEKLVNGIIGAFGGLTAIAFGKEILVFIISLLPILELRGGLLAGSTFRIRPHTKLYNKYSWKFTSNTIYIIINNKILNW